MRTKVKVTFEDCTSLLSRAQVARIKYASWETDPKRAEVVEFVKNFNHEYLFQIGPSDVENVKRRSTHPLGDVAKEEQMRFIEDFTTPFALQHLFHWYIETKKGLPTWQEYRTWMVFGDAAPHWYDLLRQHVPADATSDEKRKWTRAARWRLGKFYLSCMREIDLLAKLRHAGVPVKYHLLADVLLRADYWIEDVIICVYFPNPNFRAGQQEGRKPPAELIFRDALPPFKILDVPITRQGHGRFWLVESNQVNDLVREIRDLLAMPRRS